MKLENQLQISEITWFRNTKQDGVLWANDNNATSVIETMAKRSKGLIKGCSDLSLLQRGQFIAIENKIPGSVYTKLHLLNQIEFGRMIEKNGGIFYFCFSLEEFKNIVLGIGDKTKTEYHIDKIINCKTKTFKF